MLHRSKSGIVLAKRIASVYASSPVQQPALQNLKRRSSRRPGHQAGKNLSLRQSQELLSRERTRFLFPIVRWLCQGFDLTASIKKRRRAIGGRSPGHQIQVRHATLPQPALHVISTLRREGAGPSSRAITLGHWSSNRGSAILVLTFTFSSCSVLCPDLSPRPSYRKPSRSWINRSHH